MKFKEKNIAINISNRYFDAMRILLRLGLLCFFVGGLGSPRLVLALGSKKPAAPNSSSNFATVKSNEDGSQIYAPISKEWKIPAEQTSADLELFWSPINARPREFETVGDLVLIYDFNQRATQIFEKLIECNHGDFNQLRQDYALGKFCSGGTYGDQIRADYAKLHEETRGWLSTSNFSSPRDPKFGQLGLENPLKNYSNKTYGDKYGYNTFIKFNVLWIQIVLEIAARNALYPVLDEAEYKKLLQVYRKSREENFEKWREELMAMPSENLTRLRWPENFVNESTRRMYSSNRSLHTTLKLFSYLSTNDCQERGLFPEVAPVVTEGWNPTLDVMFDPEFGSKFSSDQIQASSWMGFACGVPDFLKGVSADSSWLVKRRTRAKFHSVIRFYRRLDETFSKETP